MHSIDPSITKLDSNIEISSFGSDPHHFKFPIPCSSIFEKHLNDSSMYSPAIASKNNNRCPHTLNSTPFPNTSKLNNINSPYAPSAIEKITIIGRDAVKLFINSGSMVWNTE